MLTIRDIESAREVIADYINRTPVIPLSSVSAKDGGDLYIKAECLQKTGAFKPRGCLNKVHNLCQQGKRSGIIGFSSGNHAQGMAYAAQCFGVPAVVLMPDNVNPAKLNATKAYGAETIVGGSFDRILEIIEKTSNLAAERGLEFVHPVDDYDVMAGHATLALEILEDLQDVDAIVTPVGGGGMLSGVATAVKHINPKIKVYGVGPKGAGGACPSFKEGKRVLLDHLEPSIADGIITPTCGELTFEIIHKLVDDIVEVTNEEIIDAMKVIMQRGKVVGEPAGSSSVAAVLSGKIPMPKGKRNGGRVVCVLSGGNVNFEKLKQWL